MTDVCNRSRNTLGALVRYQVLTATKIKVVDSEMLRHGFWLIYTDVSEALR
jgi:hypothetical protein